MVGMEFGSKAGTAGRLNPGIAHADMAKIRIELAM
jgi:hypothetical protein